MSYIPKSIDELKGFCEAQGMPLKRMRFFIGEDFKEPKAFGIYQDGDRFVVYKNKANGTRAVRYHGPDESYAVKELYTKLIDECHMRGIYPDGETSETTRSSASSAKSGGSASAYGVIGKYFLFLAGIIAGLLVFFGIMGFIFPKHKTDGYYRTDNTAIYYKYGDDWYTATEDTEWHKTVAFPEEEIEDYYLGKEYQDEWNESAFTESSTWSDIKSQESSSSSSSDYDSWDFSDTDWDSDW